MATLILNSTTSPVTTAGQLEFNTDKTTLVVGDGVAEITIAKLNSVNSGSFNVSGDVTIGGTITIGDNTSDNLVVNADLSSSIIPNNDNAFDLGSTSFKYRVIYANIISGSISASNGVISGSSQITTFGFATTSSLTTISASAWGAFQSASSYSSSFYTTINTALTNTTTISASAFGAFQSASSYSASIYTRDANQDTNITTNSASAWGAFQSASSYSSSFSSSLSIVSKSVYDLSSSLAGNSTLSSSIYQTDVTQSTNISTLTSKTGSYATTGSNTFSGSQIIYGDISASGNISASNLWINGTITTYELHTTYESASVIFSSGSQTFGDNQNDKVSITGSLEVSGSTNFIELTGSLVTYSTSVDSRIVINSASAWGAFQSASVYSASLASSITSSNTNILTISASAWGAFQSASSYSGSFYTTINNATQSILINSQSAWGAFQSASSYSSSFYTTINNTTQSVSTLSSSIGLLQTFSSSQYKNDSSSFDSRIDNLILGAGAQVGGDNEFTGQNSFTQYITGSISGAVDGIDVRALSASLNTRVTAATNEQFLGGFATTSSVEIISASAWGAFQSASSYSGSFYTTINNTTQSILINSQSAWGAFQSASSYSASFYTTINTNITNITAASASAWGAFQSASSYSSSFYTTINTNIGNITQASASAWGAFQSASLYSSSLATSISASNYNITNNSSSFATSISASNAAATSYSASADTTYAKLGVENTFTQNQIISGSLNVTGDVVAYSTSDERLKDNIKLISNPIEKVQQLRGVEFDWNDKSMFKAGKHDYGVIAQDVQKVLPELVKESHTGYLGVDYDKIIGLLIEVVKEQEKRIKELENKVSS